MLACPGMPSLAGLEYGKTMERARGPTLDPKGPSVFTRVSQKFRESNCRGLNVPYILPGLEECHASDASGTFLRNVQLRLESDVKKGSFATTTTYICANI